MLFTVSWSTIHQTHGDFKNIVSKSKVGERFPCSECMALGSSFYIVKQLLSVVRFLYVAISMWVIAIVYNRATNDSIIKK